MVLFGLCSCKPDGSSSSGRDSSSGGGDSALADALRDQDEGLGEDPDDDPRPLIGIAYDEAGLPFRAVQGHLIQQLLEIREEDYRMDPVDAKGSQARQIEDIESFVRRKAKVIIVFAFEAEGLAEVLGAARAAGVKILCVGSAGIVDLPADLRFVVDEYEIGRIAGKLVVDRLKRKMEFERAAELTGAVVEITGVDLEGDMSRERSAGFHEVLAAHPGIRVVHQAPGLWNEGDAVARVLEALRLQPEIDVIYAHNDAMAYASYLAAREKGRHQGILFVGTDGIGGPVGGIAHVRDQMMGGTIVVPLLLEEIAMGALALADSKDAGEADRAFTPELVTIANSHAKYREHTSGPEKLLLKYELTPEEGE